MQTLGYQITGGIADYKFGTMSDAVKRLNDWAERGMITEKELASFIIQLFHQIPEQMYNDIVENS